MGILALQESLKWPMLLLLGAAVFMLSYHYNKRRLDWLRFQSLGTRDYIAERLALMFIEIAPEKILLGQLLLSFGLGAAVFLACLPYVAAGLVFALLVIVIGWKAPKPIVDFIYRRRVNKMVLQMVDGLSLMSNAMKSGLSIAQAIGLVTDQMPNPIKQEFTLVLNQNKLGVPLEEALTNLSKRVVSDDVEMFVTAVNILKETGGNLAETFDTIVYTIRERIKIEKKIQAMTQSGFLQGVAVMCIPPALAFVYYQADPEFMMPLFTTPIGLMIMLVVVLLQVGGFFMVMKIIKIEV
jgi:tight adherence protein B